MGRRTCHQVPESDAGKTYCLANRLPYLFLFSSVSSVESALMRDPPLNLLLEPVLMELLKIFLMRN